MKTLLALFWLALAGVAHAADDMAWVDQQLEAHRGDSGVYVLDTGAEALVARAWLADHARESIDVQYFIWSTDNIGILAAESLLRAADRGVQVRVIVDDLLIDAPDDSLLALAQHPRIDIRVYNPKVSVGVSTWQRLRNVLADFRGVNQRMHDKTFVVDGRVAITGGRNMAAEYFDYHHAFNFRDRDALVAGPVAAQIRASFERFWASDLTVPVERRFERELSASVVEEAYRGLHAYAHNPEHFAPEVHEAIATAPSAFPRLAREATWGEVAFLSDRPGKNESGGFDGGGATTAALAQLLASARSQVTLQSPYLVLSDAALRLFEQARTRGVRVRIHTNSLASTDNLQAFSGYRNQRAQLLAMGIEIRECRPDAQERTRLMQRAAPLPDPAPIFALHAKTLVVDSQAVFIGTFNLDPRSANLNTEVGVVVRDAAVARAVEAAIETDMAPDNSWDPARDDPDAKVSWSKRAKVRLLQWLPLRAVL